MQIIWLILFLLPLKSLAREELYLGIGDSRQIGSSEKVWVENGSVLRLTDLGHKFEIKGLKLGSSLIRRGANELQVYVISPDQAQTEKILNPVMSNTVGIHLAWQNGELALQGRLVRWNDWKILSEACKNQNCKYAMKATMHPLLWQQAQIEIRKKLKLAALPSINMNQGWGAEVRISEKSPAFSYLQKELSRFGINTIKDISAIDLAPLVRVNITLAEVKKESSLNYGIRWPASYTAQIMPKFADSGEAQYLNLQLLEKTGNGKILANPNILCRSGKEAKFLAGGEFPIKILNYKVQDVVWKKYGIVLKVKPLADQSGRMSISIETEVSSIDSSRTVDGIPGLYTNRVQSHFDLSESRTIALSGLIKSEQGQSSEGLPGFKNIPILGALFSSRDWRENRTELVIFVRPEIINPSEEPLPLMPGSLEVGQL